eukprot:178767-Amorphochlora_amoeboformis.AAC.1
MSITAVSCVADWGAWGLEKCGACDSTYAIVEIEEVLRAKFEVEKEKKEQEAAARKAEIEKATQEVMAGTTLT